MTEAELQARTIEFARSHSVLIGVTPDSRRAFSGEPDLRLVGNKGVLWAELKDATNDLSPAQKRWKWRLVGSGQAWRLWRPADWTSGEIKREIARIA